ncbi:hypothetical protein F5878DRAFT_619786 [Lentinula raphanica]|uniref:Barwin-like endoglucanase n=1 Tax=Lentinula raphanica TaxID=153919 RepID=A0AA38UHE4_9AGAR|nr:hypothetical protein F5878DRAFT_619786 [Lentinula raphanica]
MHALSIASFVLLSALVTAPAAGYVVPRKETPSTYAVGYLEDYQTYHDRYLALGCQYEHNNATFFNACCHPMLATETLETARPSYCIPSTSASASASAAEATSTVTTLADGDNGDDDSDDSDDSDSDDCDDGDDDDSASSSVAFTPSATADSTTEVSSPTSSSPEPTTSSESTPTPTSTPEAAPTSSLSSSAQATPTSGSSGSDSDSDSNSDSESYSGHGTYFYQNGVAGACGDVHSDSDSIVAITSKFWGDENSVSDNCGKTVSITALGQTHTATVADLCPTCDNENDLDMSVGLFQSFTDLSVGEIDIVWSFA